jgi:hypothetical protein
MAEKGFESILPDDPGRDTGGSSAESATLAALSQLDVQGLDYDSRRVQPGFLFFAFPGSRADGRQFARDAVDRGAVAVASESPPRMPFPRPGLKSNTAATRWRWPPAISIAIPTSASPSPASPAPTAKPPHRI